MLVLECLGTCGVLSRCFEVIKEQSCCELCLRALQPVDKSMSFDVAEKVFYESWQNADSSDCKVCKMN